MKVSNFSGQQIAVVVKPVGDGLRIEDVCQTAGVSQQTHYRWRPNYGGLMLSEVRRLKQLEDENRRLKQMLATPTKRNQSRRILAYRIMPRRMAIAIALVVFLASSFARTERKCLSAP